LPNCSGVNWISSTRSSDRSIYYDPNSNSTKIHKEKLRSIWYFISKNKENLYRVAEGFELCFYIVLYYIIIFVTLDYRLDIFFALCSLYIETETEASNWGRMLRVDCMFRKLIERIDQILSAAATRNRRRSIYTWVYCI